MTPKQIEIGNIILKILFQNGGQQHDPSLEKELLQLGYSREEIKNTLIILIEDHELIRRNIGNPNLKHLTEKGTKAVEDGLRKYFRHYRIDEFTNGYLFKIFQFIIPTFIAGLAVYYSTKENDLKEFKDSYYNKDQVDSIINHSLNNASDTSFYNKNSNRIFIDTNIKIHN